MAILDDLGFSVVKPAVPKALQLPLSMKITQLEDKIKLLKAHLKEIDSGIATIVKADPVSKIGAVFIKYLNTTTNYPNLLVLRSGLLSQINDTSRTLSRAKASQIKTTTAKSGSGGGAGGGSSKPKPAPKVGPFKKNVAAVKEAYFRPNQSFFNKVDKQINPTYTDKFDSKLYAANQPSAIAKAQGLWAAADTGSKGMLQTWVPKYNGGYLDTSDELKFLNTKRQEYGFQFLYNPGSVNMTYGGMFDVDPGYVVSGNDKFQGAAMSASDSHISFEILLNRMYDMKYLEAGGKLKPGLTASSLYPGVAPTTGKTGDLGLIYDKGTMYDVEFLLKAVTGLEQNTELRGKTADLGFLGAIPVELHLGKSLRYLVTFDSVAVNHVIFDSRMVPLFTTVSFSGTRIPDMAIGAANGSGSSSSNAVGSTGKTVDAQGFVR